ncbi:MAG TPA: hypothetical protein VFF11_15055, partial [Candidatus Binatia bacterium]|nr:hypothetical protein [Candidatus Binatia bacterium]
MLAYDVAGLIPMLAVGRGHAGPTSYGVIAEDWMDRFARGQFQVAYEARVDVSAMRQKRVANAQRRRKEAEVDALLVWKD